MAKSVVEYTARRITYETRLPIAEVIARLDSEINKEGGGSAVFRLLREAKNKAELEAGITSLTNGRNFVYFAETTYHRWLNSYRGTTRTPQTYVYTFGNPLIAQGMLQHDMAVALHVPLRILISEKGDGCGTRVVYDDPATLIPVPTHAGRTTDEGLRVAAAQLAEKLEALIRLIVVE